jgi:O-antigen/teichoic acid export membrane protein
MDANDLVVGKVLGFFSVAILSRAQGLMNMFHREVMTAVRGVALPAFAAAHRSGEALEAQYARSVALVTVFAWPFYGLIALYALEVLRLLYGSQWDAAAPLVPIFCLAGAIAAVNALIPSLVIAVGRIDLVTRAELILQPFRFICIAVAAVVSRSVEACGLAYLLAAVVALPVFLLVKVRAVPHSGHGLARQMLSSLGVTVIALIPATVHVSLSGFGRAEPMATATVAISGVVSVFVWVAAAKWLRHPICSEPLFIRFLGSTGLLTKVFSSRSK